MGAADLSRESGIAAAVQTVDLSPAEWHAQHAVEALGGDGAVGAVLAGQESTVRPWRPHLPAKATCIQDLVTGTIRLPLPE
jgi:hypothetical protein